MSLSAELPPFAAPRAEGRRVRVILADDHPELLESLVIRLSADPLVEVVGMATDTHQLVRLATQERPDVALVDIEMPGGGGVRATTQIRLRSPNTKVVALTAHGDRDTILQMIRAGASGYLTKTVAGQEIIDAVHQAAAGLASLSGTVASEIMDELSAQLERREREEEEYRSRTERVRAVLEGRTAMGMFLQPISDLDTGRVRGLEALARFNGGHEGGPELWFAEAEAVGLRRDLELAAVRAALGRFADLPTDTYLSINVSPDTMTSPGFLDTFRGVDTERVVIEVTEHAPVDDYDALNGTMAELRRSGGRLAIDDAGAGFASLQHVLRLSPDYIKLDISLTRGIDTDPAKRALASALISFAPQVGAAIIAEGVETAEQVRALCELGVPHGQGNFLAPPALAVAS